MFQKLQLHDESLFRFFLWDIYITKLRLVMEFSVPAFLEAICIPCLHWSSLMRSVHAN